jgi:hypothetical protein
MREGGVSGRVSNLDDLLEGLCLGWRSGANGA